MNIFGLELGFWEFLFGGLAYALFGIFAAKLIVLALHLSRVMEEDVIYHHDGFLWWFFQKGGLIKLSMFFWPVMLAVVIIWAFFYFLISGALLLRLKWQRRSRRMERHKHLV